MKLRFGIDATAHARIRARLDAMSKALPIGRRFADVYLDTPESDLASRGVALRFRRSAALGARAKGRGWRRQEVWPKTSGGPAGSIKKLGIRRLKQRLDATFTVRIERWTWATRDEWAISLDHGTVSTGAASESFDELRIICKRKRADAAMKLAVELGAMHLSSRRARERGSALLQK